MASYIPCFWGLFFSLSLYLTHSTTTPQQHVYIVYLGLKRGNDAPILTSRYHFQLLSNVFASEGDAKRAMVYSYQHSFSGFSAKLNATQATALTKMKGVISVFKSRTMKLHTTRSWDFLGLNLDTSQVITPLQLAYGDDVIVGVFDTGIWPESKSFQEEPFNTNPIPKAWKGKCVEGERFNPATACNRKLIGARYYLNGFENTYGPLNKSENPEFRSPRDFLGHGTHTASTAVGSISENVGFFGLGHGTARGGAPRAKLAVYKVCWGKEYESKCTEADILAAFDDALHDGVHVISVSLGKNPPLLSFFESSANIGGFHAMQMGVSVVFSAGNDGPDPSLVTNVSPWSISVAASSIDRMFSTKINVNNSVSFMGESLITTRINAKLGDATNFFKNGICTRNNWSGRSSVGRVVLCFSTTGPVSIGEAQAAILQVNASGLIFVEAMTRQLPEVDVIPTVRIDMDVGTKLENYIKDLPRLPPVEIGPTETIIGRSPAPSVAYFSSRGPSSISPDFLKPDIAAPGVSILAAWPTETPATVIPIGDGPKSGVEWNVQSGTSMACPHVSGVVALIKSAHPHWSPAAIRSALITTADSDDTTRDAILAGGSMKESDPFDIGAGHINPMKAMDPGLVYDMKTNDYILFLCNIGYTQEQIKKLVLITTPDQTDTSCKRLQHKTNTNLNYPSITVPDLQSAITIKRTVHNVALRKYAVHFVSVINPNGVEVIVWPRVLIFSRFKEENSYYVSLKPLKKSQGRYDFGEIVWSDGCHKVRSPLVVRVNNVDDLEDFSTLSTI